MYVKQGSVFSPAFCYGSPTQRVASTNAGLTISGFCAGEFLHVDDVRTLATSEESLKCQIVLVNAFVKVLFFISVMFSTHSHPSL